MATFRVYTSRSAFESGFVDVRANTPEQALEFAEEYHVDDIEWDGSYDPGYGDIEFYDVEKLPDEDIDV